MVATIIADPKMEKVLQKTRFPENMHPCLKFKNISSDLDNTAGNDNTSEVISVSIQKKL